MIRGRQCVAKKNGECPTISDPVGQGEDMPIVRDPASVNQDCLICLANARAAMEALNEVDEALKEIALKPTTRLMLRERTKLAWYALHLRKSVCHGHHEQEMGTKISIARSAP